MLYFSAQIYRYIYLCCNKCIFHARSVRRMLTPVLGSYIIKLLKRYVVTLKLPESQRDEYYGKASEVNLSCHADSHWIGETFNMSQGDTWLAVPVCVEVRWLTRRTLISNWKCLWLSIEVPFNYVHTEIANVSYSSSDKAIIKYRRLKNAVLSLYVKYDRCYDII